ncbi:MAG: hypothetical protein ABL883_01175 [Terricaulis sp.]
MAGDKIAIVTVHGTGDTADSADGQKWFQRGGAFGERLRQRLAQQGLEADIVPVLWSGANSAAEREKGAEKLAGELRKCARRYASVHVVGHSHGGNVANEAAVRLRWGRKRRSNEPIASLTTVGTPFLNLRTGLFQRLAGALFFLLTWGSIVIFPLLAAAMWFAENRLGTPVLLTMFGLVGACLLFMYGISQRGARRIFRPRRSDSEAHQVYAIWHENDEAISFLRRVEDIPIEPFPKGSLFRGSSAAAISWGVLAVLAFGLGVPLNYMLGGPDIMNFGGGEADRSANIFTATIIAFSFAPAIFVLTYGLYRFLIGGAAEIGARKPLNGFVSGVLRGVALGRDGDQVICNVSTDSHTHATKGMKLEGECAQRMQSAAGAAADKLIEKYRWSLFTVGADTNAPLSNLATDAMTWDSLIHTTYFDQPEVVELVAAHIVARARGG